MSRLGRNFRQRGPAQQRTLIQRAISLLRKYGTAAHYWDFGISQEKLAYAAGYPNVYLSGELSSYATGFESTSGISGVGATVAATGNELVITSTSVDGGDRGEIPLSGLTIGATYKVVVVSRRGAQGTNQRIRTWSVGAVDAGMVISSTNATATFLMVATAASGVARFYSQDTSGAIGDQLIVASLSVREVHASATAEFLARYPLHHLFQDSAGTLPLYAIGQPCGLVLDQGSGSVVLGAEKLSNTGGPFANTTGFIAGNAASLSVVSGAMRVQHNGTNYPFAGINFPTVSGSVYKVTFRVVKGTSAQGIAIRAFNLSIGGGGAQLSDSLYKTANGEYTMVFTAISGASSIYAIVNTKVLGEYDDIAAISVREVIGAHAAQSTTTKRPIMSARVNMLLATTTLSTQSVTTLAASYKLTFTGSGTVTLSGTYVGSLVGGGTLTFTATEGTLTLTVSGSVTLADLRPANSPQNIPSYQRVTSATDYDTVGFPARLVWDGVDDCLVVPVLDLSGTDKVTVIAGVGKLSDAVLGNVFLHGNSRVVLYAPSYTNGPVFTFRSFGTAAAIPYVSGFPSPVSAVVTASSSISTPFAKISANRVTDGTSNIVTSQGTGNYVSDTAYIGTNATGTYPFNGSLQSLTVIGNLMPDGEVKLLEDLTNKNMGKVY